MAQEPAAAAAPDPKPEDVFAAREFADAGSVLRYRLLEPVGYDKSQKYPLVLFLHGAGERGADNARQLIHGGALWASEAMRRRHPAFVLAPQCPENELWVSVPWSSLKHTTPAEASSALDLTLKLIEKLQQEFSIDADRVYGCGLSMGGYGTWDLLARRPGLLAAAVPICGGGDDAQAGVMKDTPIWAFHGGADDVVPPERSRMMVQAIVDAGGRPIYTEYEGGNHNSWSPTFDNRCVWDWMFAQRRMR